jgi:beta-lactamase class A
VNFTPNKTTYSLVFIIIALVVGFFAHWLFFDKTSPVFQNCKSRYQFINPEPGCEVSEEEDIQNISSSMAIVNGIINKNIIGKNATQVSVFFRDLITRRWFGINENDNYKPGSLLKLPLLISYFKFQEVDNTAFDKEIVYIGNNESRDLEDIKSGLPLENKKKYTVRELIEKMIIDSDNDSAVLLFDKLEQGFIGQVYVDLGIYIVTKNNIVRDYLSAKTYGSMFRPLYNASYLTREDSDKALKLLSQTTFKEGLVAGVPADTKVAHKFGETTEKDPNNGAVLNRTLHDCGIIYAPGHPYVLCIMTKGRDFSDLKKIIKDISEAVYKVITN